MKFTWPYYTALHWGSRWVSLCYFFHITPQRRTNVRESFWSNQLVGISNTKCLCWGLDQHEAPTQLVLFLMEYRINILQFLIEPSMRKTQEYCSMATISNCLTKPFFIFCRRCLRIACRWWRPCLMMTRPVSPRVTAWSGVRRSPRHKPPHAPCTLTWPRQSG